jgi:hypothetical protein
LRFVRRQTLAALLAFMANAAWSQTAFSAPDDAADAETLIARGIELREHGKDDEALAVFKKALAKTPSPRGRAQVALAEQALGLWVAAESDLVLALAADSDPWIVKNRGALDGALAVVRRHLGSLEVRGTDGAEVSLDGVKLGVLPIAAPFRVEAGSRTLELRAKGFHPTTRAIEVPAGGVARETVTLVVMPPEASSGATSAPSSEGKSDHKAADVDPGRTQRVLGFAFTGTGAALLATGGIGLLVRKGIVDDYNTACPGLGVAMQPADCDNKIESARTWLTVSIISLVAGGVFALGGLTLVLTSPRREAATASGVRVGCAPSSVSSGGLLSCVGSF